MNETSYYDAGWQPGNLAVLTRTVVRKTTQSLLSRLAMAKKDARKQILDFLKSLPKDQLQQKSLVACEKLCAAPEYQQASVVMMFLSLVEEVDTTWALKSALADGKTVLVPGIDWNNHHLVPMKLTSLDCPMKDDRYGLRYPAHGEEMSINEIDFIVVPGLGFDEQGNRLGRGGGFYDRFLSHDGLKGVPALCCGLALEEQILEQVPVHQHDVRLHMLVTDQQVRRFEK